MLVHLKCIRKFERKIVNSAPPQHWRGSGSALCRSKNSVNFIRILSKRVGVLRSRLLPVKNRNLGKLPKFRHTKLPKLYFQGNFRCPKWQPNATYKRELFWATWKHFRKREVLNQILIVPTFGQTRSVLKKLKKLLKFRTRNPANFSSHPPTRFSATTSPTMSSASSACFCAASSNV